MSKILRREAKAQNSLLKNSMTELARLQDVQKIAANASLALRPSGKPVLTQ
jgi:hypothetical protein